MLVSFFALNFLVALIALGLERIFGYPDWLYRLIKHPVVWIGSLLSLLDRSFNKAHFSTRSKHRLGVLAVLIMFFVTLGLAIPVTFYLRSSFGGVLFEALLASTMLAQKSLEMFVNAVRKGLASSLEEGRMAVSHIVGRDPKTLNESDVTKAAIESLAENTADGVIAPLFWMLVFGLPGAVLYKAINTADSMIGYKNERYEAFGRAAAKLDDWVNLPASRLSGLLFILAAALKSGASGKEALRAMVRDARHHVSPNAGWPESAMAGALHITLGGSRFYDGKKLDLATMGSGRDELRASDISAALSLYRLSLTLATSLVGLLMCVTLFIF